jgi:uncharacterized protein
LWTRDENSLPQRSNKTRPLACAPWHGVLVNVDPWFFAAAIPAVLLMGLSKSGFGSGFGSLAVPIMALSVPVPQAAAIFMPLLLVMDLLGIAAFRRDVDKVLLRFLLPFGVVGIGLGTVLFQWVSPHWVAGVVGVLTLLFLAQQLVFPPQKSGARMPSGVGAGLIVASGFTSFVAHAGGPPYAAYMLGKRLSPVVYTATAAYFFFIINLSKWLPYTYLGLFDSRNLLTSLLLVPVAFAGVWLGIRLAKRIQQALFYRCVHLGMFLTGCKLIWDAFA